MPDTFNTQYIEDHAVNMHTFDSWARSCLELLLRTAVEQNKEGTTLTDPLKVEGVEVFMKPVGTHGCIRICIRTKYGVICFHKPV